VSITTVANAAVPVSGEPGSAVLDISATAAVMFRLSTVAIVSVVSIVAVVAVVSVVSMDELM
jgi:hypothetical protein